MNEASDAKAAENEATDESFTLVRPRMGAPIAIPPKGEWVDVVDVVKANQETFAKMKAVADAAMAIVYGSHFLGEVRPMRGEPTMYGYPFPSPLLVVAKEGWDRLGTALCELQANIRQLPVVE